MDRPGVAGDLLPEGLLATAGDASTDGLRVAAATSAGALAVMAVVTGVVLRGQAARTDDEPVGQR